jgi:CRISPR-associated endonuclease/helicase Cas3
MTATRLGLRGDERDRFNRCLRSLADGLEDGPAAEGIEVVLAEAVTSLLADDDGRAGDQRMPGTAWTRPSLERLAGWLSGKEARQVPAGDGLGSDRFVLVAPRGDGAIDRDDEQPECSSLGLAPVTLRAHHLNVGERARQMADALGVGPAICAAVEAAARWHDLGKAEGRFQTMLCGGDTFDALLLEEPLAKSGLDPTDRAAFRRARLMSGLPPGARHEAWSAALVGRHLVDALSDEVDRDLIVHLVASHHGHARPWLPPVVDDNPTELTHVIDGGPLGAEAKITIDTAATVDFEHPHRFATLNRRYGRWGLALLESIVRCADMTVSAEGS